MRLDHLIVEVNDRQKSIDFYTNVLGFPYDGEREPFSVVRIDADCVLQLAPFGTKGGTHLAFSMTRAEFDAVLARIQAAGIDYGDSFDAVGNMRSPGEAAGARGVSSSVYVFDRTAT